MKFVQFWFESNQIWGRVDGLATWKVFLDALQKSSCGPLPNKNILIGSLATFDTESIERGKIEAEENYLPNFGMLNDHSSELSLEDWARKNGMYEFLTLAQF